MLTGLLVFCMPESATQIVIGMLVACAAIFFYGKARPYVREQDDSLAEYAQWAVFFSLFASLLLYVDVNIDDGYGDMVFGGIMVSVNVLVGCIAVWQILVDAYAEEWAQVRAAHRGATWRYRIYRTLHKGSTLRGPLPSAFNAVAPEPPPAADEV